LGHYLFNFSKKGAAKGKTLREQAAELLEAGMWGIGTKTPNRLRLAPGDRVVIYVGAPEYAFVGRAELGSAVHEWTPQEADRYPGDFTGGVALSAAEVFSHPIPIKSILDELPLRESNPAAHFFSGVVRIKEEDYQRVVDAAGTREPLQNEGKAAAPSPSPVPASAVSVGGRVDVDLLFHTSERLRKLLEEGSGNSLSEYDTRAVFIDRYLEALGYTEIEDIQRGSPVESGNFPDYVLRVNKNPVIAIEAKKLGAPIASKEAAQVVQYCSTLGVRWGAVTDGRFFKLYDAPVLGVPPHERLVVSVDLTDYKNREDFEARIYRDLELIAKNELESGAGLQRRVAQEAVREMLTGPSSKTLRALRSELEETKAIKLSASELSELVSELLT
jgi:predicted type IV restriction endonuclease